MAEHVDLITDAQLFSFGLAREALDLVTLADRDAARKAASDYALAALKKRYALPLSSWSDDLRRAVAHIAVFDLLSNRGFDPGTPSGELVIKRADDARFWLRDVARGIVEPVDIVDATEPSLDEQHPLVMSDDAAGWPWPTTPDTSDPTFGVPL